MKITRVQTLHLTGIPIQVPFLEKVSHRSLHLVVIESDNGLSGIAEIGHAPISAVRSFIERDLAPFLLGECPLETERLLHQMYWRFNPRGHSGVWNVAVSAIDAALWDMKGKFLRQPLWRLLGGAQKAVPAYLTFGLRTYTTETLVEAAKHWVASGHSRLKIMVGRLNIHGEYDLRGASGAQREQDPTQDALRIEAVREAVGPSVELMVDASCLFSFEAALRWCKRLEPYDLMWFEEPVVGNDVHLLAQLRNRTSIPIAAGQWADFSLLTELARHESVDILNPTSGFVGGFTMAMKAAALAQAFKLPIANGTHQDIHLHAAIPNAMRSEFHLEEWLTAQVVYENAPSPVDGWVTLTEEPGLGLTLRNDVVEEFSAERP